MSVRSYLGHTPRLGEGVFIDPCALVLGDVHLGADSSVWPQAVVRGDVHYIRIGARTNVQDGAVLHVTHDGDYNPGGFPLLVGDDVTIAHRAVLHGCTVRARVLIGMGTIIMDGALVHPEVMIAAGSLVSPGKILESGYLYRGSPARQQRPLSPKEREFLHYSAAHYVRVKRRHQGLEPPTPTPQQA